MKSRESRKLDHIRYALCVGDGPCASGFSDVHLLHHCLSGICRNEVDLTCLLPGLPALAHPIIINAITGGADAVAKINESLAIVARETGSAMAVGSQFGTVRTGLHRDSYTIVRKCNPKGFIFANLSAFASVEQAKAAIDMISADALQIHLNPAQELAMEEGGIEPSQVDYINAHGTSTHHNDLFETRAIKLALGDAAKDVVINSTKSMIGHLLGAAGGVEFITCVKTIQDNFIHQTVGTETPDEECDLNYAIGAPVEKEVNYVLTNSLGFGGHNAVLLLKRYED